MNGISGCSARCKASSISASVRRVPRFAASDVVSTCRTGFVSSRYQIAELVPRELVERGGGEVEAIVVQRAFHLLQHLAEARANPAIRDGELDGAARGGRVLRPASS